MAVRAVFYSDKDGFEAAIKEPQRLMFTRKPKPTSATGFWNSRVNFRSFLSVRFQTWVRIWRSVVASPWPSTRI